MAAYVDEIDINFSNECRLLRPGQAIKGSISLGIVNGGTTIIELLVTFFGEAKTAWIAPRSDIMAKSREVYLKQTVNLSGFLSRIQPCVQSIPFSYTLPLDLPPSFESEFGHIRYTCSAHAQLRGDGAYVNCERLFVVLGCSPQRCVLSATDAPDSFVTKRTILENVGYLGLAGSIELQLTIPRSDFRIGETISADVLIKNKSRLKVKSLSLDLMQCSEFLILTAYQSTSEAQDLYRMLDSSSLGEPIKPTAELSWKPQILVPPTTASFQTKLIGVRYFLRLRTLEGELTMPVRLVSA